MSKLLYTPVVLLLTGHLAVLGTLWPILPIGADVSMRYAMAIVIFAFVLSLNSNPQNSIKALTLGLFFSAMIALVPMIAKGYSSIYLSISFSFILAYLVHRYPVSPKVQLLVFGLLSLYVFFYYLNHGELNDVFYRDDGNDKSGVSRNYVGILFLQQYLIYYVLCIRQRITPQHWPLLVMLVLAILASGVGSTLASLLAVTGYLIQRFRVKLINGIMMMVFFSISSLLIWPWIEGTILFQRVTEGDFLVSRLLLWSDFFEKISYSSFWIGFSKDASFIDHAQSLNEIQNLHNSYLNIFKQVGIFSIFYFSLIIYTVKTLFGQNFMLAWLLLCALLRALTDGYFFSNFLIDFVLFFLFLMTPIGGKLIRK